MGLFRRLDGSLRINLISGLVQLFVAVVNFVDERGAGNLSWVLYLCLAIGCFIADPLDKLPRIPVRTQIRSPRGLLTLAFCAIGITVFIYGRWYR